jgi:hypothetical protein
MLEFKRGNEFNEVERKELRSFYVFGENEKGAGTMTDSLGRRFNEIRRLFSQRVERNLQMQMNASTIRDAPNLLSETVIFWKASSTASTSLEWIII